MRGWFGSNKYISPKKEEQQAQIKQSTNTIQSLQQLRKKLEGIENYFSECHYKMEEEQVNSAFEDVIISLRGLMQFMDILKQQMHKQCEKISEYDKLKAMVKNHHQILHSVQQSYELQINKLYEEKKRQESQLIHQIEILKSYNLQLLLQNKQLSLLNIQVSEKLNCKDKEIQELKVEIASKQQILKQMSNQTNNLLNFEKQKQVKVVDLSNLSLIKILYYKKLRINLMSFLQLSDIFTLSILNKEFHFVIQKSCRKDILRKIVEQYNNKIQKAQQNYHYYQKIFQKFSQDNIKQTALKYLFFKIKPGAYIFPFIDDIKQLPTNSEKEDSKKQNFRSTIKSFFQSSKKKQDQNKNKFSIALLKDQKQFKIIQQKIETFFHSLFSLRMPNDLHNFQNMMKEQLEELKDSLKHTDKLSQILCLMKFMFYQLSEVNNLLQACFGILVKEDLELRQIQMKLEDKIQSEGTLRNLVQQLIKQKNQVDKTIWKVYSQMVVVKQQKNKFEKAYDEQYSKNSKLTQELQTTKSELQKVKELFESTKKKKKELQHIITVIKEDLKDWNSSA